MRGGISDFPFVSPLSRQRRRVFLASLGKESLQVANRTNDCPGFNVLMSMQAHPHLADPNVPLLQPLRHMNETDFRLEVRIEGELNRDGEEPVLGLGLNLLDLVRG